MCECYEDLEDDDRIRPSEEIRECPECGEEIEGNECEACKEKESY